MVEQIKTMYSWNDIMILCKKIVDSVRKKEYPFTCILTIPRGGLVPARIISELLDIKKIVFSVADVKNSDFTLIVDDISDSGKTLVKLVSDYQTTKGLSYKVATVFVRDGTHYEPDFFGERLNHDKWIEFPWEAKSLTTTYTITKRKCTWCGGSGWFVDTAGGHGDDYERCGGTGVETIKVATKTDSADS